MRNKRKIFTNVNDLIQALPEGESVFTNGCFDILHPGHTFYLNKSRDLADYLIVGLNSDRGVTRLKGPNRPVNSWKKRSEALAKLNFVDYIINFEEDTPLTLIKLIKPRIITKGGDYTLDEMIGKAEVESYDGKAVIIPYLDGHSTSALLNE